MRAQYTAGHGQGRAGARLPDEKGVDDSTTETYVAPGSVDNWRWQGVPIYLGRASGPHEGTEIAATLSRCRTAPSRPTGSVGVEPNP